MNKLEQLQIGVENAPQSGEVILFENTGAILSARDLGFQNLANLRLAKLRGDRREIEKARARF